MKKIALLSVFLFAMICGFSQTTVRDSLKAQQAKVRAMKLRCDFVQINPDTLASKKGLIYSGKTTSGKVIYYMRIDKKFYLISDMYQVLRVPSGVPYNMNIDNDSLQIREENTSTPLIKFQ